MFWTIFLILLALDVVVYFSLWFDTMYYRHNLPNVCKNILEKFIEEEEETE